MHSLRPPASVLRVVRGELLIANGHLDDLLKSRKVEDRVRAVELMSCRPGKEFVPQLIQALNDRSTYVAETAARALGKIGGEGVPQALIERFLWYSGEGPKRDKSCSARKEIAITLGKLGDRRAADALRLGMRTIEHAWGQDIAVTLRGASAISLAEIQADNALIDLAEMLFDGKPFPTGEDPKGPTRKAAAKAIAGLAEPGGEIALAIKLMYPEGESSDVLVECMEAMVALESENAVRAISPFLTSKDTYLAANAGLILAKTRLPEVLPLLKDAMTACPDDAILPVMTAIASLRSDAACDALMELAEDCNPSVRKAAVTALEVFSSPKVKAFLEKVTSDKQ